MTNAGDPRTKGPGMFAVADRNPFVGRIAELAQVTALLERAIGGAGAVALVAGEPGIGKTRLADELARGAAERGVRALWGRCHEGEGAPAFWPWTQLLRGLIRDGEPPGGASAAPAPELRALLAESQPPALSASAEARFRLFDGITRFLAATAAAGPLLLLLDDLHWADTPSLLLLEFLAPALVDAPIVIVGTYRDTEAGEGHPLARTLGTLLRQSHVAHATLGGLDGAEVARLIEAAADGEASERLVAAISGQTEGNPLFVTEMLRLLAGDGRLGDGGPETALAGGIPATLRAVIGRRLGGLSEGCNALLAPAAVIGREFETAALIRTGAPAGDALIEALVEAETARIIIPVVDRPGRYRFAHALIRETIYAGLPAARRIRLHQRVGDALLALHGDAPDPPLAELAHHFFQAAPAGAAAQAVTYARRAADHALAILAYEEAARLYGLALQSIELVPGADAAERAVLLLALGEAQTRAADTSAGEAAFWQAATLARALIRQGRRAAAPLLARAALGIAGPTLPAHPVAAPLVDLLQEAVTALGEEDSPLRAEVLARLATDLRGPADQPRREALIEEAVAVARRAGEPRALASALLGRHNIRRGTPALEEQLALATEALRQAEAAGDSELAMWAYRLRAVDLMEIGDVVAFDADADAYARLAERLREPYHLWQSAVWRAMRAMIAGRFAEAVALVDEALALGLRGPTDLARLFHALQIAAIGAEHGSPDEAIAVAASVLERFPLLQGATAALLPLYLAAGRDQEARREYDRLIAAAPDADLRRLPRRGVWLAVMPQLAAAAAALGDAARAAILYALLLPDAGRVAMASPGVACYGPVAHYLGLLAATLAGVADARPAGAAGAQWADAARHFEDALATETRLGARAWLARTRYEYAAALLRRPNADGGRPRDGERTARALLEESFAGARELRMTRLAAQAERLLAGLSGPTPDARPPAAAPGGLSPRELEVLRLLAGGKTNAEIAATLVLSPSTVKRHAENIYAKIGASRRADAIAYALRHGLLPPASQP